MFSLVQFGKRHKKKLIFSFFFFGGTYVAIKYTISQIKQTLMFSSKAVMYANQQMIALKKKEHYLTIKTTSDEAIVSLTKSLDDYIKMNLSSEDILENLKQKPTNKIELWDRLKIICISKGLTTIYSLSILCLIVKIHLNIIGAYLYISNSLDKVENNEEYILYQNLKLSSNVQQKYLENIENFVKKGIVKLTDNIQEMVAEVFKDVNLKDNLTIDLFGEKFDQIKSHLLHRADDNKCFVLDYVDFNYEEQEFSVYNQNHKFRSDEQVLNQLNLETLDLLNSRDFTFALESLVNYLTNEYLNKLTSLMIQQIVIGESEKSEAITISMPFAKLIPLLDRSHVLLQTDHKIVNKLLDELKLNLFSENIYEAFSYLENSSKQNIDLNETLNLFGKKLFL